MSGVSMSALPPEAAATATNWRVEGPITVAPPRRRTAMAAVRAKLNRVKALSC
jgi:hypothetical protein